MAAKQSTSTAPHFAMTRVHFSGRRSFGVKSELWQSFNKQQKKHIYTISQRMKIEYENMIDPFTEEVVAPLLPYIDLLDLGNLQKVNSLFEKYVNERFKMFEEIDIGKFEREKETTPNQLPNSEGENDGVITQMTDRKHNKKISKREIFKQFVCTLVTKCPNLTKIYGSSPAIKFFDDVTMRQFSSMKKLSKISFANVTFGADTLDQFLLAVGRQLTELSFIDVKALTKNGMKRYSYYDVIMDDKKEKLVYMFVLND
uniref:F-box domain-containing protein n=1 Tax=Romanomermis culicivorax TaxID=13658 RepID=A0A915JCF8_ROMCU